MTAEEEAWERSLAAPATRDTVRGGFSASLAVVPVVRTIGPLQHMVDTRGNMLSQLDWQHPYGPRGGRKVNAWMVSSLLFASVKEAGIRGQCLQPYARLIAFGNT